MILKTEVKLKAARMVGMHSSMWCFDYRAVFVGLVATGFAYDGGADDAATAPAEAAPTAFNYFNCSKVDFAKASVASCRLRF